MTAPTESPAILQLREALEAMLQEKADYMIRNHLGDPYRETTTQLAAKALADTAEIPAQQVPGPILTWQERVGFLPGEPIHKPSPIEKCMLAEIAELRAAIAAVPGKGEPSKQWPFVESPGEFGNRMSYALRAFDGDMLAAVRYVLIENPATIAQPSPIYGTQANIKIAGFAYAVPIAVANAITVLEHRTEQLEIAACVPALVPAANLCHDDGGNCGVGGYCATCHQPVSAAPVTAPSDHDEAVTLLSAVFDAWENGDSCYEDPQSYDGYLGTAFRLDDDVFKRCCDLLNRLNPPRNAIPVTVDRNAVIDECAEALVQLHGRCGRNDVGVRNGVFDARQVVVSLKSAATASVPQPAVQGEAWQPIETAPKGGRELILLLTPSRFPQVAYSNTWWTSGFSVENKPTHWMPIPATPEQLAVTQQEKKPLTSCASNRDGDCSHPDCPQLRDNEPHATGRHCPIDTSSEDYQ